MTYEAGDKVKVNGSIQEIENITQWDKDTQRYKFVVVSGWNEIKDYGERIWPFAVKEEELEE